MDGLGVCKSGVMNYLQQQQDWLRSVLQDYGKDYG
jgi:hypothetical protein